MRNSPDLWAIVRTDALPHRAYYKQEGGVFELTGCQIGWNGIVLSNLSLRVKYSECAICFEIIPRKDVKGCACYMTNILMLSFDQGRKKL